MNEFINRYFLFELSGLLSGLSQKTFMSRIEYQQIYFEKVPFITQDTQFFLKKKRRIFYEYRGIEMIDKPKKIISSLMVSWSYYYRDMVDYSGSEDVKKYTHTSKIIRRYNEADFERILELHDTCFGNKKYDQIIKYSRLFRNIFYILEVEGKIVAFMGFYVHKKFAGLHRFQMATGFSLCVDPSMRGKGTVLTIISESLKELKNNNVKVVNGCIDANNKQSLAVHQKFGFKIIGKNSKRCGLETYTIELKF
jgi:ribosomal-protein-alanine N-acetyltransferase